MQPPARLPQALLGFHKGCEKTQEETTDACWHLLQVCTAVHGSTLVLISHST